MKYDFLILGGDGAQGMIVARDLLDNGHSVFLADLYSRRVGELMKRFLKEKTAFAKVDLRNFNEIIKVIRDSGADVVVNCAEGDWNLEVYKACLATKVSCIDLGSHIAITKEQLKLDKKFQAIKRIAITGCGAVPGVGNVMLRYAARKFDSIDTIDGGFAWDSNIKKFVVPFSIESIMEEFTLPAPHITNRKWREKLPIDSEDNSFYRSIGYQKSFLVNHAEIFTFYHYFKNKGVKNVRFWAGFPEHSTQIIKALIDLTFHIKDPVKFNGIDIQADEFLAQMLKRLERPKGYKEWENLWIEVTGSQNRKKKTVLMECLASSLKDWEDAGCNIDTGMPASIIAQMIKKREIDNHGSFAPEGVVPEKSFFQELRRRKMSVYENGKIIN